MMEMSGRCLFRLTRISSMSKCQESEPQAGHHLFIKSQSVSASSPLMGFGKLNDNTIKGLTSLLSVEQEIEFIAYTYEL